MNCLNNAHQNFPAKNKLDFRMAERYKDSLYKFATPLKRSQHDGFHVNIQSSYSVSHERLSDSCQSCRSPTADSHNYLVSKEAASISEQHSKTLPTMSQFQVQDASWLDKDESGGHMNMRRFSSNFVEPSLNELGKEVNEEVRDPSVHVTSLSATPDVKHTLSVCGEPATAKKVKNHHVIASRYLSTVASSGHPPYNSEGHSFSRTFNTTTKKSRKPKNKVGQSIERMKSEVKGANEATNKLFGFDALSLTPQSFAHVCQPSYTPVSLKLTPSFVTSTPAHAAPTLHNISGIRMAGKVNNDNEVQTELLSTRLLQAAFIDTKSARSLRLQEGEAKSQCHKLWQLVEEKKMEILFLWKTIELEERTVVLEKSVEIQLQCIGSTLGRLKLLEQYYSSMTKALDNIGHEIAFKNILHTTEDIMQETLFPTEHLLSNISAIINEIVPKVSSFTNYTEALVKTLEKQCQELEMSWEELGVLIETQLHGTSLLYEQRQRS